MFEKVLSKDAKKSLVVLGKSRILNTAYLAGGTALALQIGHRFSFDFDFFTLKKFDERILVQRIKRIVPEFKLESAAWRTILGYIQKTRFSLFFYDYPLLFTPHKFLKINIADIKDIAPMKIAAISDRGRKRDFIDLYFILKIKKILTLEKILKLYDRKFKALKQNKIHILKSLSYFEEAERDEMPKMIEKVEWEKIKQFFEKETKKLSKNLLK